MKPTADELEKALTEAENMREQGNDPDHLSKSLLYLHKRLEKLEKVFDAANQYMRFGQEEHEHAELLKALDVVRRQEESEQNQEKQDFGL